MAHFHPDPSLLMEYSNGTIEKAKAICVATHLAFCSQCLTQVKKLDDLSGKLMESQDVTIANDLLAKTLSAIDSAPASAPVPEQNSETVSVPDEFSGMPKIIRKLISGTPDSRWRKISSYMKMTRLKTGQRDYEVALQKICAGGKTPLHDHNGEEYTVVLKGSFSDEYGVYHEGDFIHNSPGHSHQPLSAQHEDCICLAALSAPIKLRSPLGWLFTPWLRIKPM